MIAVLQFPGSNCDRDVQHVLGDVLGAESELVWWKDFDSSRYGGLVVPGGFSYGDYLRAGAIAARTDAASRIGGMVEEERPVLGICNGFQVLVETGLLQGALMTNRYPKFVCRDVHLRVESTDSPFTSHYEEGEVLKVPIAHREGNYRPPETGVREGEVALRYCGPDGGVSDEHNPNGSFQSIAGVTDGGNVLGLMPHPERASEGILGSDDGLRMMRGLSEAADSI
ncbi:MAG: Phosphoribosylformylglycinamidine synthase subunit PurQ [Methanonatronarchaeales archaeon]|nr:Phosphoribosylformylglycinamidine synthase subunit PurQ [Methanonatronarchaeales archaeon]